jgi:2-polyprenyl-3-methyl-5-hydroxy-6-metoxy-1,4-benzoquinol methylase
MRAYAIRGGKEGKERLNLLARVMLPTTSQLLKTVGLRKRIKCLDVGCGGGHVTLRMASMVVPEGKVTGMDADEQIIWDDQSAIKDRHLHSSETCRISFSRLTAALFFLLCSYADFSNLQCDPDLAGGT